MIGDFERYLAAKETVDGRALDRRVRDRFRADLRSRSDPRVLEAGTGTAAFLCRMLGWEGLPDCTYVAVDTDPELLAAARDRILDRARVVGFDASAVDPTPIDLGLGLDFPRGGAAPDGHAAVDRPVVVAALSLRGPARIDVRLVAGDAVPLGFLGEWEFVVAQAFADLLPSEGIERLLSGVVDGGGVYLPITFDGDTSFTPSHPADGPIVDAYHASMRTSEGRLGASAGRRLLTLLPDVGVDLDAVGGSDWVVAPLGGRYPADELFFLGVILDTIADAVRGRVRDAALDAWLDDRREDRAENRLGFVARNLDLYGRVRADRSRVPGSMS
jgi:SAM-dependent methyltransferase